MDTDREALPTPKDGCLNVLGIQNDCKRKIPGNVEDKNMDWGSLSLNP